MEDNERQGNGRRYKIVPCLFRRVCYSNYSACHCQKCSKAHVFLGSIGGVRACSYMSGPETEGRAKAFKAASECSYGQRNHQDLSEQSERYEQQAKRLRVRAGQYFSSLPFVSGTEMLRTCRPLRLLPGETWALLHCVLSTNINGGADYVTLEPSPTCNKTSPVVCLPLIKKIRMPSG